ncbi:unnamed protein product, partial [Rotaria sp. Silwood2]
KTVSIDVMNAPGGYIITSICNEDVFRVIQRINEIISTTEE